MLKKGKLFLVFTILLIAVAVGLNAFIIYQSCLGGPESTDWSEPVVEAAADIINTIKPDTITPVNKPDFTVFIRKAIGHYGLFGLDGLITTLALIFATYNTKFFKKYHGIWCSLLLGVGIAFLTEGIQLVTPGRSGELVDAVIDSAGYLTSFIFYLLLLLIIRFKTKKKAV